MAGLILKVMSLSAVLSIAIKYGGPWLPVFGNTPTVVAMILLPSVLMAIGLGWRWQLGVRDRG